MAAQKKTRCGGGGGVSVLEIPTQMLEYGAAAYMPSQHCPSDHLPLAAWTSRRGERKRNGIRKGMKLNAFSVVCFKRRSSIRSVTRSLGRPRPLHPLLLPAG
jgi:hypothetical protein